MLATFVDLDVHGVMDAAVSIGLKKLIFLEPK